MRVREGESGVDDVLQPDFKEMGMAAMSCMISRASTAEKVSEAGLGLRMGSGTGRRAANRAQPPWHCLPRTF